MLEFLFGESVIKSNEELTKEVKMNNKWLVDYWNDFSESLGKIILTISFRLILAILKTISIGAKTFVNEMSIDLNRGKDYEG